MQAFISSTCIKKFELRQKKIVQEKAKETFAQAFV
jgi:hypothetical protein